MVDPGCSGGGFDDVQDLHEQRVVIVLGILGRATLTNAYALETIPQTGPSRRVQRWEQSVPRVQAGGIEDDWRGIQK